MNIDDYCIDGDSKVKLERWRPDDAGEVERDDAEAAMPKLLGKMLDLQERLYASRERSLLIVLQGRDAAGKDGTIKHVMGGFNPLGTRVHAFKAPNELERAHDFLWRIHHNVPETGHVAIFNRSHYEDILVPVVRGMFTPELIERRHEHIRSFEALLADAGVVIIKLFLHISKDEQRERLQERLDQPDKRWKFDPADLQARADWDKYGEAYERLMRKTSTPAAPWYIIPADRKWFRNYLVAQIVVNTLEGLKLGYPAPPKGLDHIRIE
ncbi:MAG: polyphosphate kinase 2 family protein [Nannocystis sp.]|nr:PPK2 family polyphosphate kinase [Nannocystis sp.]MBA3546129.1 polyphosphate kinase 2 family protein [Nannocystis sp.]